MRWAVAKLLGHIGDSRALPHLDRIVKQDRGETSSGGRVIDAAREAIEQIRAPELKKMEMGCDPEKQTEE